MLREKKKFAVVVATDLLGISAALHVASELGPDRVFTIAGYSSDENVSSMVRAGEYAAVAMFSPERLISKAVTAACALGRGQKVPERVELIVPIMDSPPDSTAPKLYQGYRKMVNPTPEPEKRSRDDS